MVIDGLGRSNPVDLEWLDQEEHVLEKISSSKSKKNNIKKVSIKTSRPVTRSQKNKVCSDAGSTMAPGKPSNKNHSPKYKKK